MSDLKTTQEKFEETLKPRASLYEGLARYEKENPSGDIVIQGTGPTKQDIDNQASEPLRNQFAIALAAAMYQHHGYVVAEDVWKTADKIVGAR